MKKAVRKASHPLPPKPNSALTPVFPRSQSTVAIYRKGSTPLKSVKEGKKTEGKAGTLADKIKGAMRTKKGKTGGHKEEKRIKDVSPHDEGHDSKHRLSIGSETSPNLLTEKVSSKPVPPKFPLPLKLRSRGPIGASTKELMNYLRNHSSMADLSHTEFSFESTVTPVRRRPVASRSESRGRLRLNSSLADLRQEGGKVVQKVGFRTQTGAIGGKPKKNNQDSVLLCQEYGGVQNQWLFGVFDGHGANGHDVSGYIKNVLPARLLQSAPKSQYPLSDAELRCLSNGFVSTFLTINHELSISPNIDSIMSGSTAVAVLAREDLLVCANVGDSRAIVGRLRKEMWTAVPLSKDHKPDDPVERSRIELAGGRVEPYQGTVHTDPSGEFIGPVRVWNLYDQLPGLAMSRSMGDFIAEEIGVIAEPEIMKVSLAREDKFIVVASDGIWEFISSQMVHSTQCVNLVASFWQSNNVEGACEKLLHEALAFWKRVNLRQDDDVIDDITVIVAFLSP